MNRDEGESDDLLDNLFHQHAQRQAPVVDTDTHGTLQIITKGSGYAT